MRLTIVIPALNEEEAIATTIERCQTAAREIEGRTPVDDVELIVVSDGSTDRTAEIAQSYEGVSVIVFETNRGYGAAIKAGWEQGRGDLLAFLDADGTCNPDYFVQMCNMIEAEQADIVIGSRMGSNSKMPGIRRLGNKLYVTLLKILSKKHLTDSASGMRVVRRSSLHRIYPLPNGLHFTPAMSARALMDQDLRILEIEMDYEERIGKSKLSVLWDGLRFLKVIVATAAYIRPSTLSIPLCFLICLFGAFVAYGPIKYYLAHGELLEWMIYRFILLFVMGSVVMTILCATIVAEHTIALTLLRFNKYVDFERSWWAPARIRAYLAAGFILLLFAVYLVYPGIVSYVSTGEVYLETLHWSRVMLAAFLGLDFLQLAATASLLKIINSLHERQTFLLGRSGVRRS